MPPQRRYVTHFLVLVNPRLPPTDELAELLYRAINALERPAVAAEALAYPARIYSSTIGGEGGALGQEVGGQFGYLHQHFTWRIVHAGNLRIDSRSDPDGLGINRRLQRYFRRRIPTGRGIYVRASLNRQLSYTENYNLKQQQRNVVRELGDEQPQAPQPRYESDDDIDRSPIAPRRLGRSNARAAGAILEDQVFRWQ